MTEERRDEELVEQARAGDHVAAQRLYRQHVDRVFPLDGVTEAHQFMEKGQHISKLVLRP